MGFLPKRSARWRSLAPSEEKIYSLHPLKKGLDKTTARLSKLRTCHLSKKPPFSLAMCAIQGCARLHREDTMTQGRLDQIHIQGAREHNLQNLTLSIPKRKLVVFTGPSGSGKSSLAFDTLYTEGQRRYVDALSAYARQFMAQSNKPDYDKIHGLSPTISIKQKSASMNPRSTVGTITEIHDYFRLLFARLGVEQKEDGSKGHESAEDILEDLKELDEGTRFYLLAPKVKNRKGEFRDLFEDLLKEGFVHAMIDGEAKELEEDMIVLKSKRHTIDAIIDRLVLKESAHKRILQSIERALAHGDGECVVQLLHGERLSWSLQEKPELTPQHFSFNSPLGMCPDCNGIGHTQQMNPKLIIKDASVSINEGAIEPMGKPGKKSTWGWEVLYAVCESIGADPDKPWNQLNQRQKKILLHGMKKKINVAWKRKNSKGTWKVQFEGIMEQIMRRYKETSSAHAREIYGKYLALTPCNTCKGARLHPDRLRIQVKDRHIGQIGQGTLQETLDWVESLRFTGKEGIIATELVQEISSRLRFLLDVGLGYLSLNRPGPTLSGGELQRIRLASQLGGRLNGVLYILDEPSIGLHQRDNHLLIQTLQNLRDRGNSIIVVEHDADTMKSADWLLDFGPGAGVRGGDIIFQGDPNDILHQKGSITGQYLSGAKSIETRQNPRSGNGHHIVIRGACANNLKNIDAKIPLGVFTCIAGVSGAGKSSLVNQILCPAVTHALRRTPFAHEDRFQGIEGIEHINKLIEVDQSPIGRTPRSNPATYVKVFDEIRNLFANLPMAKVAGYDKSRFSFNRPGGRCDTCEGAGQIKIEMRFLPDSYVPCQVCNGRRFNDATLKIKYKGLSIADVLSTNITDALELFEAQPKIRRHLQALHDVGLGYITLGQSSTTLSGGEAQRIKLSKELARVSTGRTLYVLDEPSTGLHFDDIQKLLLVVNRLVDAGNTVVMIEHNLDIIRTADHVIDMGPEGGAQGGQIVAEGTAREVALNPKSVTGRFLKAEMGL